jgi:DNA replication and repair protein RecF
MNFEKIKIRNFRNIKNLDLEFSKSLNIIIGHNGQGKTNLIEALILLIRGESFRFGKKSDFISITESSFFIESNIHKNNLNYDLQFTIAQNKKNNLLNGKKISNGDLNTLFPYVLFSPESLSCIKEGSEIRRQLIDDLIFNINSNFGNLRNEFLKALRTRNKILKDIKDQTISKNKGIDLIESINPFYGKLASEITLARLNGISEISEDFRECSNQLFNRPVDISVEYVVSGTNILKKENNLRYEYAEISEILFGRMHQLSNAELSSGTSLVGPQKHDINFLFEGNNSRIFCSQGQQRTLILSFKMAQIVYHRKAHLVHPLLFLDDVLSELDSERVGGLIQFLKQVDSQIFLTTTDEFHGKHLLEKGHALIRANEGRLFLDQLFDH